MREYSVCEQLQMLSCQNQNIVDKQEMHHQLNKIAVQLKSVWNIYIYNIGKLILKLINND